MAEKEQAVNLPSLPKGKEFEEYLSAYFQTAGHYIERNLEEEDILELDIIMTDYNVIPPNIRLVEVKSGDWGFSDIFKVRGWMDYLNLDSSVFISSRERFNIDFIREKAKGLGIDVVIISDLAKTEPELKDQIEGHAANKADIASWRFSYWMERNLLRDLIHKKKSTHDAKRYEAMLRYYYSVNSGIFFERTILDKVQILYSVFKEYPHISAKVGNELEGNDFEAEDCSVLSRDLFEKTFIACDYTDIQFSTFIEHRARLAILKSAVDYILYKKAGDFDKAEDSLRIRIMGQEIELSALDWLPNTFKLGMDEIERHPFFHRYPVFWQWFMWIFGGFILNDYEERELALLSEKTGISVEEIPNAFVAYDLLFPTDDGWFHDFAPNSNIRRLKMFPVPFMGVGANYRRFNYCNGKDYQDLLLTGRYTQSDLIRWNNLAVDVLIK